MHFFSSCYVFLIKVIITMIFKLTYFRCVYQICRTKSRATRKINFEDNSQILTISSLTEKSVEDTNISLQVGSS